MTTALRPSGAVAATSSTDSSPSTGVAAIASSLAVRKTFGYSFATWRFHLRRGVKFQGGEPFTADDVVFTQAALDAFVSGGKAAAAQVEEDTK